MKPVDIIKDITDTGFRECLATIFELPVDVIPDFGEDDGWNNFLDYLVKLNLTAFRIQPGGTFIAEGYTIAVVQDENTQYCVVFNYSTPVFDPFGGARRRPPYDVICYIVFGLVDPAKVITTMSILDLKE